MPSRRERAIERANTAVEAALAREGRREMLPQSRRALIEVGVEAALAELAADLESEETVDQVARAIFASDQERRVEDAKFSWAEAAETTREFYLDDARAALRAALELDGG